MSLQRTFKLYTITIIAALRNTGIIRSSHLPRGKEKEIGDKIYLSKSGLQRHNPSVKLLPL